MTRYTFDRRIGRYRESGSGRLISEKFVRDAVDALADGVSGDLAALSRRLLNGEVSLAEWQAQAMATIKSAHVATAVVAKGGRSEVSPADFGRIGQKVREQYRYVRSFAQDIAGGRQPLNGTLPARAQQYGQAARVTYEAIKAADDKARGMQVERNVLHGRDHCGQCPKLTAKGWVPIGSLPPIGSRPCRVNDRCTIERRLAAPRPSR